MTVKLLSMSHDQNVIYAMLGKNYWKIFVSRTNGPITFVMVCLIRDMGLTNCVQMMILG